MKTAAAIAIAVLLLGSSLFASESSGSADTSPDDSGPPQPLPEGSPPQASTNDVVEIFDVNRKLMPEEIAQLAANAGFAGDALVNAVSIALAESGGNTLAYNPEAQAGTPPGMGSYGLWQIYRKVHPEFTPDELYDPQLNAHAAFKVYQQAGRSFQPWSTYKNGSYRAFLAAAQRAGVYFV